MTETLQILEKLNSLYSGAISQLITYTVGVLAFVGILIPAVIAMMQNRQMKRDQEALAKMIAGEIGATKASLQAQIQTEMQKVEQSLMEHIRASRQEIAAEVAKSAANHRARTMHLQAQNWNNAKNYGACVESCFEAIMDYVASSDEGNLRAIIHILNLNLPELTKSDFDFYPSLDAGFTKSIAAIETLNKNGGYRRDIEELTRLFQRAKTRDPKPLANSGPS